MAKPTHQGCQWRLGGGNAYHIHLDLQGGSQRGGQNPNGGGWKGHQLLLCGLPAKNRSGDTLWSIRGDNAWNEPYCEGRGEEPAERTAKLKAMGIKAKFNRADVRRMIQSDWAKIEANLFSIMAYVGESYLTKVRAGLSIDSGAFPKGNYQDQTANLRSSTGYFILKDGLIVKGNTSGTPEGQQAAKSMLGSLPKLKRGYQLIGVAGMDYASRLEAMGYNVISSQAEVAMVDLSKQLKAYAAKKGFDMDVDFTGVMAQMR